jgi:hypothetical protein
MLSALQIRNRVPTGLATARFSRLPHHRAKLRDRIMGPFHACDLPIRRGHVYELPTAKSAVRVHLECYLFWLHISGAYEPEPITCTRCRFVIPPHRRRGGRLHHDRC